MLFSIFSIRLRDLYPKELKKVLKHYPVNSILNAQECISNLGGTDPVLISVSNLDLSEIGSICYHIGVAGTGVTLDYSGNSLNSNPSIEAYEY